MVVMGIWDQGLGCSRTFEFCLWEVGGWVGWVGVKFGWDGMGWSEVGLP